MNTQYLQYVREQLIMATADLSGTTKGQLQAWLENAQFDTKRYKRKKHRVLDEVTGKLITLDNPPIPGKQSMAKGSTIELVQPAEYATASWRRALLSLDGHHKAWLLWNYSGSIAWDHQVVIVRWAWEEFSVLLAGKRIAKKTMDRLRQLIWLAAQDVKAELACRETYQYRELAALVGISNKAWSETFTPHWECMIRLFVALDSDSLRLISETRSRQKATNFQHTIAKVD